MNIKNLLNYDFAMGFAEGRLSEHRFLAELIDKIKKDEEFRKKTQIFSIEVEELKKVSDALKIVRTKREEAKVKPRRGFLEKAGLAAAGALLFGKKVFALDKINARKLFEEISKLKPLQPCRLAYLSGNLQAPTIILIEDLHGGKAEKTGWKIDYNQLENIGRKIVFDKLEILRGKFGLNFVGIEGWACHEADSARGRQVLIGDPMLIKKLIDNKNYRILGLEHPTFQIATLEFLLADGFIGFESVRLDVTKYFTAVSINRQEIDKFFDMIFRKMSIVASQKTLSSIKEGRAEAGVILEKDAPHIYEGVGPNGVSVVYSFIVTLIGYLAEVEDISKQILGIHQLDPATYYRIKTIMQKKLPDYFNPSLTTRKRDELSNKVILGARNKYAVIKMLAYMKTENIGIIVFGRNHTKGLITEFLNRTGNNINLIVLENPNKQ